MSQYSVSKSGLILPEYIIKKEENKPLVMDFFAGAGGFSLGFIQAGWKVIAAVEWEPNAALTYLVNLGSYPVNIHYVEPGDKERLNKALELQRNENQNYEQA